MLKTKFSLKKIQSHETNKKKTPKIKYANAQLTFLTFIFRCYHFIFMRVRIKSESVSYNYLTIIEKKVNFSH